MKDIRTPLFKLSPLEFAPEFRPADLIRAAYKRPHGRVAKKDRSRIKLARKQKHTK